MDLSTLPSRWCASSRAPRRSSRFGTRRGSSSKATGIPLLCPNRWDRTEIFPVPENKEGEISSIKRIEAEDKEDGRCTMPSPVIPKCEVRPLHANGVLVVYYISASRGRQLSLGMHLCLRVRQYWQRHIGLRSSRRHSCSHAATICSAQHTTTRTSSPYLQPLPPVRVGQGPKGDVDAEGAGVNRVAGVARIHRGSTTCRRGLRVVAAARRQEGRGWPY